VDVDPEHPVADAAMDVRALALADASFDLVLCAHVLDVFEEHDEAVAELHRVTRPGGRALVQAPWRSVHGDPVAYAERLTLAGFEAEPVYLAEQADETLCARYGIDGDDPIFVCLRRAA
jgi:SAM-dependent methyltransferase